MSDNAPLHKWTIQIPEQHLKQDFMYNPVTVFSRMSDAALAQKQCFLR